MASNEINLSSLLSEYVREVDDAVHEAQDEVADEMVTELKATSPKNKGKYARSWAQKRVGGALIVYNKRYQLTHLLEKGHLNRNGTRTAARPHIAPAAEKGEALFLAKTKAAIEGAK